LRLGARLLLVASQEPTLAGGPAPVWSTVLRLLRSRMMAADGGFRRERQRNERGPRRSLSFRCDSAGDIGIDYRFDLAGNRRLSRSHNGELGRALACGRTAPRARPEFRAIRGAATGRGCASPRRSGSRRIRGTGVAASRPVCADQHPP
jgi:hypothetical protein